MHQNNINSKTTICAVIGDPIEHSLSPVMHNAGYEALGLNFAYTAFRVRDQHLKKAIDGCFALHFRGISVTTPHKVAAMKHVDKIDPLAQKIGAINTIVNDDGKLRGLNTDCEGAMRALKEKTEVSGKHFVLVGAGGAARAIVFGLKREGADVTIVNRTAEKAEQLAKEAGVGFDVLSNKALIKKADGIINATAVGMHPNENASAIDTNLLLKNHIVFDIVYNPKETLLLREAKKRSATIVYGYKMLLYQAVTQFELFTGKKAPVAVMEHALINALGGHHGR